MTNTAYLGGATDKSVTLTGFTASTGVPYTAGAYNTAGITAKYRRAGTNAEATITLATQTVSGAHSDGGFVHISGGRYRLDLPDAAIAAGSDYVDIWVYGITDTFFTTARIDILAGDPRSATVDANVTQISGDSTAADNAELFFDGTGYAGGTTKLAVNAVMVGSQTASASGTVTFPNATLASTTNITAATGITVSAIGANVITAAATAADFGAEIADAVWDEVLSGHVTGGSAGVIVSDISDVLGSLEQSLGAFILTGGVIGSTGNDTTHVHLPFLTYGDDEIVGYYVTVYDASEDEKHTRYITDWVNATKLATLVDALPFTPQDATDVAYLLMVQGGSDGAGLDAAGVRAAIGLASANLDTQLSTIDDLLDTEVAAIKAKTDNLPSDPADASVIAGLIAATEAKVDTIDTVVDAIKAKTDNLPSDPADASVVAGLIAATEAKIDTIDTVVDAVKVKTDLIPAAPASTTNITAAAGIAVSSMGANVITAASIAADVTAELQSGLATAASLSALETKVDTVDTVADAIKAKTDSLTFTQAGHVDANVQRVNDVAITGNGASPKFAV